MATTGFWPVKGRLKEVIDYADNPDKTTQRKYLEDDLAKALEHAENDSKIDRILEKSPHLYELLQTEHRLEKTAMNKNKERSYER